MDAFIESIREGSIFAQALFVAGCGLAGVFLVLFVFFGLVKLLSRAFKPLKSEKEPPPQLPRSFS